MNEAQRQQALLAAMASADAGPLVATLALRETGARALRGLEAYRTNADALAERALGGAFATVRELVGTGDFARLAREFRHAHPPRCGDLGEWGAEFPAWLEMHGPLAPWPYLGDCSRLDLALHRCERAADAGFDAGSLTLLESTDPARLHVLLTPGAALLRSRWPIAAIHAAHRLEPDAAEHAFVALREAIATAHGEQVLVVREGWRAAVHSLAPPAAAWIGCLLDRVSLADALERCGTDFDFADWLASALRAGWLQGVVIGEA